jgi:protein TonB
MKRQGRSFAVAFLLSLLLHGVAGLLWAGLGLTQARQRPMRVTLDAVLVSPPQAQAQPPLFIPEVAPAQQRNKAAAAPDPAKGKASRPVGDLGGQAVRQASAQVARSLLYPPEAIARGWEGETLVLLFLDEAGNAVAARVERGSGHAILDEAAIQAARTVRSLPGGAAREVLLPVRFRLR